MTDTNTTTENTEDLGRLVATGRILRRYTDPVIEEFVGDSGSVGYIEDVSDYGMQPQLSLALNAELFAELGNPETLGLVVIPDADEAPQLATV